MNSKKYKLATWVDLPNRQWPSKVVKHAPIWCSVDLRDGNQALAVPMSVNEKLELYKTLVKVGFKEIEVGFPSASDTEFNFLRRLVNENLIPQDVTVQVLTQAKESLIKRTFEALEGVKNAIVHLYNSTSERQRRITFNLGKEEIKNIALEGVRLVKAMADEAKKKGQNIRLEYSPESFSDTELDYALEVCEEVKKIWKPTKANKIIFNLPETVQYTTPNIHADQIEWMSTHISEREKVIISVHTHNDRGTGVAAAELAMMAGADRLEGTLFGNGERTGNLDLVTVGLNLLAQGVDPVLDFSDIPAIRKVYEKTTRMEIHPRHPYAGDLVFTAFSGSHQDAIKKGMACRIGDKNCDKWEVPYLHIDPKDIGRDYEAIIRINSQSGKGGVAYILEENFGFDLPKAMQPSVGEFVNGKADSLGKELSPEEIFKIFSDEFINRDEKISLQSYKITGPDKDDHVKIAAKIFVNGKVETVQASGNGPINALMNALEIAGIKTFTLTKYSSHAVGVGSASDSAAYICLHKIKNGKDYWGVGVDSNIEFAALKALVSAANRLS